MDLSQVITKIAEIRNEMILQNAIANPVVMSELMVKLAQLSHLLGDNLAEAILKAKQTKAIKYQELIKDPKISRNQAEIMLKYDFESIELESQASKLELAVKSTNSLISACQSHIKVKLAQSGQSPLM
jgi:hypothetical protein